MTSDDNPFRSNVQRAYVFFFENALLRTLGISCVGAGNEGQMDRLSKRASDERIPSAYQNGMHSLRGTRTPVAMSM